MDKHALGFWQPKWQEGQTAFHEGAPNELLVRHAKQLGAHARVLVPLAGKAVDLVWLASNGHEVVGIEFVPEAVEAFFAERKLEPKKERRGKHEAFTAGGVTLVLADMFEVTPESIGTFDAIYDRAALVALVPDMRARYVAVCNALASRTLLISFAYDQSKTDGPPWSVDEASIHALFAPRTVEKLEVRRAKVSPRLEAAGIPFLEETAYLVGTSTKS